MKHMKKKRLNEYRKAMRQYIKWSNIHVFGNLRTIEKENGATTTKYLKEYELKVFQN